MYRREDISLYKIKKIERFLLSENTSVHPNITPSHVESDVTASIKFFKSTFNRYYKPLRIIGEPEIQKASFSENKKHKELYLEVSFERINTVFPIGFKVPPELLTDPLSRSTKIIFQLTDKGYQFVQMQTASKFKTMLDAYFYQEKQLVLTILEQAETLSAIDLADVRTYLWNTMPTWNFPYTKSNGLHDVDYQKYVFKITHGLNPVMKSIIRNICLLEKLLHQNYDLVMKEKAKHNLTWDDEAYSEELWKILPCNFELINYQRTAKLLALFACFDDDIGLERPTAVIGAMSPLSKFANTVANIRRNILCEKLSKNGEKDQNVLSEMTENLARKDINLECELFNQLNALRDNLFNEAEGTSLKY